MRRTLALHPSPSGLPVTVRRPPPPRASDWAAQHLLTSSLDTLARNDGAEGKDVALRYTANLGSSKVSIVCVTYASAGFEPYGLVLATVGPEAICERIGWHAGAYCR